MENRFSNGYALIIGVNQNEDKKWALKDIEKDVSALEGVLKHPKRCAYKNVEVLLGPKSTRKGIIDGLIKLKKMVDEDSSGNATVIVYYSGHGVRDGEMYYLIPYDMPTGLGNSAAIKTGGLEAEVFAEAIDSLVPQRLLVILDCCQAGGMDIKGTKGFVNSAIPPQLFISGDETKSVVDGAKGIETLSQDSGRAVLSSSKAEQPSSIRKDQKMSIFTYHLIEALTGHAQPQEGATSVLVSDIMSHVHRHVPLTAKQDWNREQEPHSVVSGNFHVALLLGGDGLAKGHSAPDPLEPLKAVHIGPKFESSPDSVGIQITGNVGEFTGKKHRGDILYDKAKKVETHHHGPGTKGNKSLSDSRSKQEASRLLENDTELSDKVEPSETSEPLSKQQGVEQNYLIGQEVIDKAFKPVLQRLFSISEARASRPELLHIFNLSAELARGNRADKKQVVTQVEELLEIAPEIENEIKQLFEFQEFKHLIPASLLSGKRRQH